MNNSIAAKAFAKMEKREHWLRVLRERWGCGRISREQFRAEEKAVIEKYALTPEEQSAYDMHNQVIAQRKRK